MHAVAVRVVCKGCGKVIRTRNFVVIHGVVYCSKFCRHE